MWGAVPGPDTDITVQLHPAADKAVGTGVINNVRCNYQNILRVKYFTASDVRYLPGIWLRRRVTCCGEWGRAHCCLYDR